MKKLRTVIIFSLVALLLFGPIPSRAQEPKPGQTPTALTSIPPGYSSAIIRVRFREGSDVRAPELLLAPVLKESVIDVSRLFSSPPAELDRLRATAIRRSGRSLPDLNLWFQITLKPGTDAMDFIEGLKRVPSVEIVEPAPLPAPPPATTPNFTSNQGYLSDAPGGIGARYAWTLAGGSGNGVTIYDVEYDWNQMHEDLSTAQGVALLLPPGASNNSPFSKDHGTAVLGELIAERNAKGVIGISWRADIGLSPTATTAGFSVADAIQRAAADGEAGDVILIEQQTTVCNLPAERFGPVEWNQAEFDAIQNAVAFGFIVVEAAGNGSVNLDRTACGDWFDRTVRDSGAIIVGAGGAPGALDRQRLSFSTYGSRVDLQGWGEQVMTTGYGYYYKNPDDPDNPDFWYLANFGGTSSASPFVAGAAANLQGIALKRLGSPISPAQMRTLLVETGSPQMGDTSEHIGPRPNLQRAIVAKFFTHRIYVPYVIRKFDPAPDLVAE